MKFLSNEYAFIYSAPYALIMRRRRMFFMPVTEWKQAGFVQSLQQLVSTIGGLHLGNMKMLTSKPPSVLHLLEQNNYDFLGVETLTGERLWHKHVAGCNGVWYSMEASTLMIKLHDMSVIYKIDDAVHLGVMLEIFENVVHKCKIVRNAAQ